MTPMLGIDNSCTTGNVFRAGTRICCLAEPVRQIGDREVSEWILWLVLCLSCDSIPLVGAAGDRQARNAARCTDVFSN